MLKELTIVSGPTGSGKTYPMDAFLSRDGLYSTILCEHHNIIKRLNAADDKLEPHDNDSFYRLIFQRNPDCSLTMSVLVNAAFSNGYVVRIIRCEIVKQPKRKS